MLEFYRGFRIRILTTDIKILMLGMWSGFPHSLGNDQTYEQGPPDESSKLYGSMNHGLWRLIIFRPDNSRKMAAK